MIYILTNTKKIPLVAIVGPTASGKTGLSIELAKLFGGEVVSADSMQIYKGVDIGVAKPTKEEMQGIPHHLIDFLDVSESFSVAQYVKMANECILDIYSRGRVPIVCGGTGLYIDSLLNNIQFQSSQDVSNIRDELQKQVERFGIQSLIEELEKIDPDYAKNIHPNNVKRIIRAIELYRTTGVTMTQQIANSMSRPSAYDPCIIGINFDDRNLLYKRINLRVDNMVKHGLLDEAKKFLDSDVGSTAIGAIGYKELIPYFEGKCELELALDKLKTRTRNYAKRQLTWFRKNKDINWIYADRYKSKSDLISHAASYVKNLVG